MYIAFLFVQMNDLLRACQCWFVACFAWIVKKANSLPNSLSSIQPIGSFKWDNVRKALAFAVILYTHQYISSSNEDCITPRYLPCSLSAQGKLQLAGRI